MTNPTTAALIEAGARALVNAGERIDLWTASSPASRDYFLNQSRACLAAFLDKLKEPSEAVLDEMDTVWQEAGIEAALSWYFARLRRELDL